MSAATVDPTIARRVLVMANNGESLRAIGNATGLLDKEIRLIVDDDRRRRSPLAAGRSSSVATEVPRPAPAPEPPRDRLAELIAQAEKSDIAKVRGAARRAAVAVEALRIVMEATERERRATAERVEKEQQARATVETLAAQLAKARTELDAIAPKKRGVRKGTTLNLTPEERERRRQQAYSMQARRQELIAERKAAADA